jgi:ACS family glucarate transporter-like MFS transporter
MGWVVQKFGWQSLFFIMGGLGFGVAWLWLRAVHSPLQHPRVNAAELTHMEKGGALVRIEEAGPVQKNSSSDSWRIIRQLLSSRMLVGIYVAQYGITTLTYFFLTWFPVYLVKERHMTILNAGFVAALPAVAGFIGGILGGVLSDRLLKAGYSQSTARKTPIVLGMLAAMTMVVCNYVQTDWLVIAVMSLAFFGKGVGALGWAVVADTSPPEAGGLSGSLFNTFGNIAGITTPIAIGYIIQRTGSFANALVFIGANALIAIVCYLFVVGEIKRFTLKPVA